LSKKKSRTESKHIPEKRRAKSSSKHSRINSGKNTACKKEVVVEKRSASKHGYSLVTGSKSIVTRHSSLPRGEAFFNIESFSNIRGPKATFDALNIKQRAEYEHRVNSSQVETQAARKRRRL
jgi:acetyl-CoA carboxylase beta subunit